MAAKVCYVDTSNEPRTDEEAVAMCTRALGVASAPADVADLQFNLGNAQARRGFGDLAEAAYRACLAADGARSDAANNLALCLMRRGDFRAARRSLDRALAGRPANAVDLETNLGVVLEHLAPPDRRGAAEAYERAIAATGGADAKPLSNLAALRLADGDVAGALTLRECAANAAPDDPYVRFNLAATLDDAGMESAAIDA